MLDPSKVKAALDLYQQKLHGKQLKLFQRLVHQYLNAGPALNPTDLKNSLGGDPPTTAARLRKSLKKHGTNVDSAIEVTVARGEYRLEVRELGPESLPTLLDQNRIVTQQEADLFWAPHTERSGPIEMRYTEALLFRQPETRVLIRFLDFNGHEEISDLTKDRPYLRRGLEPGELMMRMFHLPPPEQVSTTDVTEWKSKRKRSTGIKAFRLRRFRHFVSAGEVEFLLTWGAILSRRNRVLYAASHKAVPTAVNPEGSMVSIGNSRTNDLIRQILGFHTSPSYSFTRLPFRMDPTSALRVATTSTGFSQIEKTFSDFEKANECFNLYGLITRTTLPGGTIPLTIIAANHGSMLAALSRFLDDESELRQLRESFGGTYAKEFQVLLTAAVSCIDEELVGKGVAKVVSVYPQAAKSATAKP